MSAPKAEAAGLGLTDVLAAHSGWHFGYVIHSHGERTPERATCDCGAVLDTSHRAHVAEEVRTWFRAYLARPEVVETGGVALREFWLNRQVAPASRADEAAVVLAAVAETLGAK